MAMNRALFRKQLQEGLNTVFGLRYKRHPEKWRRYLTVENEGRKAYVEDVMMAGLGAAPVKEEGAAVAYDAGQESYTARYVFETVAMAFAITEEAEEDGLYGSIGKKFSRAMATSFQHTKAVKCANILNDGFDNTDHKGGDGVCLFSTAHPTTHAGNQANRLATDADFSETSLEDLLTMISDAEDDRGIPMALGVKCIVYPTALQFEIPRVLKSALRSGTAENDLNAFKELGYLQSEHVMEERLTDPDAWFVTTDCDDGLKHIVRKAISGGIEGDFETGNMRYKKRERYIQGWSDWRGAFGTSGG